MFSSSSQQQQQQHHDDDDDNDEQLQQHIEVIRATSSSQATTDLIRFYNNDTTTSSSSGGSSSDDHFIDEQKERTKVSAEGFFLIPTNTNKWWNLILLPFQKRNNHNNNHVNMDEQEQQQQDEVVVLPKEEDERKKTTAAEGFVLIPTNNWWNLFIHSIQKRNNNNQNDIHHHVNMDDYSTTNNDEVVIIPQKEQPPTKKKKRSNFFWKMIFITLINMTMILIIIAIFVVYKKNDNTTTMTSSIMQQQQQQEGNTNYARTTLRPTKEPTRIPFTTKPTTFAPSNQPSKKKVLPTLLPTSPPTTTTPAPLGFMDWIGSVNNLGTNHPTPKPTGRYDSWVQQPEPTTTTTANPTDASLVSSPDPTTKPTAKPTAQPTSKPTMKPTAKPTVKPTVKPTTKPTTIVVPTSIPQQQQEQQQVAIISSSDSSSVIPPLKMGPMVGHTTHESVTLWAYPHEQYRNAVVQILLYRSSDMMELQRAAAFPNTTTNNNNNNNVILHTLTNLEPLTSYQFEMRQHGAWVGGGSFRTAPSPQGGGVKFDYVLCSCMNHRQDKNQVVWDEIHKVAFQGKNKYPDFTIFAGDTIYLLNGEDVTDQEGVLEDRVWFRHYEQRTESHFHNYIRQTPIYSTWNDHDYGKNDADRHQKGKDVSRTAWSSLWANPDYEDADITNGGGGVYYSYYWGNVHYIVTDDHWYRDSTKQNRLGTKQTEWLGQELIQSQGVFKVIVIGSDILQRGWSNDLQRIGKIVTDHHIDGVLFHAGDIHRNEYKRMTVSSTTFPYDVIQITSSGIAKVWRRPFVHIAVDTTVVENPTMTAYFYGAITQRGPNKDVWTNDVNLKCSSIVLGTDRNKEHTCTETIRLSDLKASSSS